MHKTNRMLLSAFALVAISGTAASVISSSYTALAAASVEAVATPAEVSGMWETDNRNLRMRIFNNGASCHGNLVWGNRVVEADGVTSLKDSKNPRKELRSRNILGIRNLTGLVWNGKEYTDGKFYDATSGRTYNCKLWISEDDKLHLRGFVGLSLLGQTLEFHRFSRER